MPHFFSPDRDIPLHPVGSLPWAFYTTILCNSAQTESDDLADMGPPGLLSCLYVTIVVNDQETFLSTGYISKSNIV
jgi:hypothetical protein